ncbi:Hint domain-containing protein [Roseicyclus marinus]|uniref:Hint domain-containing protein n=1 Tax=Roseicyclus marinus TaxID=2161673 RepID=UPI00240EBBC7|nr:Hint domain-containing protein [Roseicyclus marinus]MDG3041891.1 Hint domain-containing protein [Roseicyclus marinus]
MATSFEVIFLGTLPLIDTTQGNEVAENAAGILGTYGSTANPLNSNIRFLTPERLTEDANDTYDTDNGGGFDSFRINGGAPQNFDAVATYNAIITYVDGTTANITAVVFQDVNGNTYLAPEITNNADQAALTLAPILSLNLVSVETNTGDMTADRFPGDFKTAVDGTAGNDNMNLGSGFTDAQGDQITTGNDYILGGDGNDTINADAGNDTVLGGAGNDIIDDWGGNDLVYAGSGNDRVELSIGNDTIFLEDGDDTIRVWDNAGNNSLNGGTGNDLLDFTNFQSSTGANVDINAGGSGTFSHYSGATTGSFTGFEVFSGTANNDILDGGDSNTALSLNGEEGNDRISGGTANDTINAGTGTDTAAGGAGNDSISGGDGNDLLSGDFVTPTIVNGTFSSGMTGWTGTDPEINVESNYLPGGSTTNNVFEMDGNAGPITVLQQSFTVTEPGVARLSVDAVTRPAGTVGVDGFTIQILNGSGTVIDSRTIIPTSNTVWETFSLDVALPTTGTYTVRFTEIGNNNSSGTLLDNVRFVAATGDDTVDGGAGDDLINGGAGNDSLIGGSGNDTVYGGLGADTITGGDGNDSVLGGDGNDTINAGEGSDTVDAGGGNDVVIVDGTFAGDDTLNGGAGNDTLVLDPADDRNLTVNMVSGVVADGQPGAQNFTNFENLFTADGNDSLTGAADANLIRAGGGNDTVTGGGGNDTIEGGAGADSLTGGTGNDSILGGDGNDTIAGGSPTTAAGPNLLTNGSFEAGVPNGNWQYFNNGTLAGWRSDSGIIEVQGNGAAGVNAADGSNYAEIDADSAVDNIYQDVATPAGEPLTLSFQAQQRFAGATDSFQVWFGGRLIDTVTPTTNSWQTFTYTVTGSGGTDRLEFREVTSTADANGPFIDNVSLRTQAGLSSNDTLSGGAGDDVILGEGGNDLLSGDDGNDSLSGGDGDDTLLGGEGNDTLVAGNNTGAGDSLSGGAGNDYLIDTTGNATLDGGTGSDTFEVGYGNATIIGGEDVDGTDVDLLDFSVADDAVNVLFDGSESGSYTDSDGDTGEFSEIERLRLTNQADTVDATADGAGVTLDGLGGDDILTGGSGDDSIDGGADDDSIAGGLGNDTLIGGSGADTLTGGAGPDVFVVDDGGDIITDFDTSTGIEGGGTPDQTDNDFVDLSAYYNETTLAAWNAANPGNTYLRPIDWLRADHADDGALAEVGGLQIRGADGQPVNANQLYFENTGVICFASGTRIATPRGEIAVEDLAVGDLVTTLDQGARPLVWTGATARDWSRAPHPEKPILLKAGCLGPGRPERDLIVSPQHRVLLAAPGEAGGILVPAKSLLGQPGVRQMGGCRSVVYHHIMLDRHHVLISNGVLTESFYPGTMALRMMAPDQSAAARALLSRVTDGKGLSGYPAARPILCVRAAQKALREGTLLFQPPCPSTAARTAARRITRPARATAERGAALASL